MSEANINFSTLWMWNVDWSREGKVIVAHFKNNYLFSLLVSEPLISPNTFCKIFPFHIMFDKQMRIVQAGKSVSRVIPRWVFHVDGEVWQAGDYNRNSPDVYRVADENCPLLEVLEAIRPHLTLTFENILAHINTIYVLQTRQAVGKFDRYLRLKVRMF